MMDCAQWVHHFTTNYPNLRYAHAELRSDFDRLWKRTDWKDHNGPMSTRRVAVLVKNEHLPAIPEVDV